MRGRDLVLMILLADLTSKSASRVQKLLAFAGYDVPLGSVKRALSQARGTWAGGSSIFVDEGRIFEMGRPQEFRPPNTGALYISTSGEIVGGMDIMQRVYAYIDEKNPLGLAKAVAQNQYGGGGNRIRDYIRSLYVNWGVEGEEAFEMWNDNAQSAEDLLIEDGWVELDEIGVVGQYPQ